MGDKESRRKALEEAMAGNSFWNDQEKAKEIIKELQTGTFDTVLGKVKLVDNMMQDNFWLIGQWQDELLNLFGIQAREDQTNFFGPGVYLVGREFAGSERGAGLLGAVSPFDLVIIDEAHEIFAGLTAPQLESVVL